MCKKYALDIQHLLDVVTRKIGVLDTLAHENADANFAF